MLLVRSVFDLVKWHIRLLVLEERSSAQASWWERLCGPRDDAMRREVIRGVQNKISSSILTPLRLNTNFIYTNFLIFGVAN